MIRNYFKISLRSLVGSKAHSVINILGLGLGIASCLLIFLFVRDEWTFDKFNTKSDRIYRAFTKEDWGENQQFFNTSTPFPLGPVLKTTFPEVENEARIYKFNTQVKSAQNQFTEYVTVGGQSLFTVFDFKIIQGDKDPLRRLDGVVMTEDLARKYFGSADPINKTISMQLGETFEDFLVIAVVEQIPGNSSIQFGVLISDLNFTRLINQQTLTSGWFNVNPETYILLREGIQPAEVVSKFPSLFKTLIGDDFEKSKYTVGLQPLTDIHLDTDYPAALASVNNPLYSYILAGIAGLILFVACINFITLSLGRSMQRAREVGIRKVVGALRRQLIIQFIGESMILTLASLGVGLGLAIAGLPLFNDLSEKNLVLRPEQFTLLVCGAMVIVIGFAAGCYPAFVLSAFRPIAVLKGKIQSSSKQGIRKVLVGVQLVLSIFLISSTLLMREQLDFLQNRDLGFNKEQLLVIPIHAPRGRMVERIKSAFAKIEQFKQEASGVSGIASMCGSSHDFGNGAWTEVGYTDDKGIYRTFRVNIVDEEYVPTLHMEVVQGRNFSNRIPSDAKRSILVNEAFLRELNWTDAIGKRIPGKAFSDHEIVGVLKDFNFSSLYTKVEPLVIAMDPMIPLSGSENINTDNSPVPKLIARLKARDAQNTIKGLHAIWDKIMEHEEFDFSFVDQKVAAQYRNDENLGKIVTVASILAILIGSFGLYGLASLAMQSRTREISIRKVMGATEGSLLYLLSIEYVYLIIGCLALSVPITYLLIDRWLQTFQYRIAIGAGTFLLGGLVSLLVALGTISYHALRTAAAQPAETLKHE